jgi:hypothetical protein
MLQNKRTNLFLSMFATDTETDTAALLREIRSDVRQLRGEVRGLVSRLDEWETAYRALDKKKQNAVRRKQYAEQKRRREEGLLPLPERHVLSFKDPRLDPKIAEWAQVGMRFASRNSPGLFVTWVVHQWNNRTYLKKPITFSSTSFRVWNGQCRSAVGTRDLMNFSERKLSMPPLRGPDEHDDFTKRPWWDWGRAVMFPLYQEMQELGLDDPKYDGSVRFRQCLQLLIGCFNMYEVVPGVYWDFSESLKNMNLMLRKVGTDFQIMLRAVHKGLRVTGSESPVNIP